MKRGLGKGKGFEVVEEYSLLDGDHPELLDLISDRIAVLYNMLYEDDDDTDEFEDTEEELDDDDEETDDDEFGFTADDWEEI